MPPAPAQSTLRRTVSFAVVIFFLVYVFSQGIGFEVGGRAADAFSSLTFKSRLPDFGQYIPTVALSAQQLALGTSGRRAIIVGDIHGQSLALEQLLLETSYDSDKDTLIHVGDIISKGTLAGSRKVLAFMAAQNISGVRGNHDQKVIEWRGWLDWLHTVDKGKGKRWLDLVETAWAEATSAFNEEEQEVDPEDWVKAQKKKAKKEDKKWWDKIPDGWTLFGDHYTIARSMSKDEYDYLRSLPLVLQLPSEHTFIAHAGILPYDPTRSITSQRQPLAHLPKLSPDKGVTEASIADLRSVQEALLLTDVKQNTDPWVVLNMRNILHNKTVSRDTKRGQPWMGLWNSVMPRCAGFESTNDADKDVAHDKWLPCHPSTVVYGHTASRGLDVHRWTVGLDSGCVYGRRLTALVLDNAHQHKKVLRAHEGDDDVKSKGVIPFGDDGKGKLISVECHKHKEQKHTGDLPMDNRML